MAEDRRIPIQVIPLPQVAGPIAHFGAVSVPLNLQDVTATHNQTILNDNFGDLAFKLNEVIVLANALLAKQNEILNSFKVGGGPK